MSAIILQTQAPALQVKKKVIVSVYVAVPVVTEYVISHNPSAKVVKPEPIVEAGIEKGLDTEIGFQEYMRKGQEDNALAKVLGGVGTGAGFLVSRSIVGYTVPSGPVISSVAAVASVVASFGDPQPVRLVLAPYTPVFSVKFIALQLES